MPPLAIVVSIVVALGVGVLLGVSKAGLTVRGSTFCVMYLLSIGLQTLFASGPDTWVKAYVRLLVLGAIPALVCHVLPAMVACSITVFIRKRRRSSGV